MRTTPQIPQDASFVQLDFETRIVFTNFSSRFYATLGVRENGTATGFVPTPLLAPGATFREDFLSFLGVSCPALLDFQLRLFRRINADLPIGLDPGEAVEPNPIVSGQITGLPACALEPLQTYSIGNLDAPEGQARVRFAECTQIDEIIRQSGIFPNEDNAWEISGVLDPPLTSLPVPSGLDSASIRGRVLFPDGSGVENLLVVLRSLVAGPSDCTPADDTNRVFSEPILFATTDATGAFVLDRPPGVYQVEVFSDDFLLRPPALTVETPLEDMVIVAEVTQ